MAKKKPKALPKKSPALGKRPPPAEHLTWHVAGLAALVLVAYWNSLGGTFHFDDHFMLGDPNVIRQGFGWKLLRLMQTRPLTYLSFHWNYLAGDDSPWGFHCVNLLLHAANSVLVLLIARYHLPSPTALVAAALFAVHTLQTEAVDYVFQRATLLATLFALLSFLLFVQERYACSAVAFALSLLAKEETIALPVFLLLYDLVRRRRPVRTGYYAAMVALAGLAAARLFYVLHNVPNPTIGYRLKGSSALSYALTEGRVVWTYLRLFLFPVGLTLDHDVVVSRVLLSPPSTLPALLCLVLLIGGLGWLAWKERGPALWALGFFVLLAPSSSVVPADDLMFEHRTYFPLSCLVMATAWQLMRCPRRYLGPIVAGILMALTVGTIARNRVWHDPMSLWTDVVKKSPNKARGYMGLGVAYATQGDLVRSRQLLEQGLAFDPDYAELQRNLGVVMMEQGDAEGALQHFQRAMALTGETSKSWNYVGAAYFRLGKLDQAVESCRRALGLDPCDIHPRINLMRALLQLGKREDALLADQIPAGCDLLPGQYRELEEFRRLLGLPAPHP